LALSDLSLRYLVPVIDVGVVMEGGEGVITGQVLQVNRLFPADPCVYCRDMISPQLVKQELMSPEEQTQHQAAAQAAVQRGDEPNPYWRNTPQLNTVGYLTTMAGGTVTGFAIGYLTGRFQMPKNRLEITFGNRGTQVVERDAKAKDACAYCDARGRADQNAMAVMISAPLHWPAPIIYEPKAVTSEV
jgi:hypothetical protein